MSENNKPLTAEEIAWATQHAEQIRALIQASAPSAPIATISLDPVRSAAADLIASLRGILGRIEKKVRDEGEFRRSMERILATNPPAAERAEIEHFIAQDRLNKADKFTELAEHEAAIRAKIARLESNPEAEFLPIGTVVRFLDVPGYADGLSYVDGRKSYPVQGSVGVVSGLKHTGEFPIAVSMLREYKDGWGQIGSGYEDSLPTYRVDRERVEVIGYGLLPNGEESKSYGYVPTHHRKQTSKYDSDTEMILEADGHFWRFHDFGGTQGVEALQAYENLGLFSWVTHAITR
jgi:hypothetical protein